MPSSPIVADSRGLELRKLAAFVRRDFLVAWSYRLSFLTSFLGLVGGALVFYFVGLMVDPASIPPVDGKQVSYLEFAVVGMALGGFLHLGLERVSAALRNEQLMGTLESLLSTPTTPATVQVGSVLFDLIFIPLRMTILLDDPRARVRARPSARRRPPGPRHPHLLHALRLGPRHPRGGDHADVPARQPASWRSRSRG